MNWVLIVLFYSTQGPSIKIGPYASHADCEKAFVVMQSQEKSSLYTLKDHFCIPEPREDRDGWTKELPEEFD